MANVQPTILIGTSTQTGAFTEAIVRDMAAHTDRPIIMPLSNPTSKCEALPSDLINWTEGRALIATGSPFAPVPHEERRYQIAQANNALVFPGLGLGVAVARASRITNSMIAAAADAVAAMSNATTRGAPLLPPVNDLRTVSAAVAIAVVKAAVEEGLAQVPHHQPDPAGPGRDVAAAVPPARDRIAGGAGEATPVFRVLVVEDQAAAAEVMATYVERVAGFEVAGHARSGADCLQRLAAGGIDLIMLDIYLPDMSGLEVLRRIRAAGSTVDVIAVTRARDLSVVQAAVSFGAMQYLVKPFTFAAVRQKLERYQAYRAMLAENDLLLAQQEVDRLMHTLREPAADDLPKGISSESLQVVVSRAARLRGRRAVRGRGRELVGLLPGHRAALPGVPGQLRGRGARRPLPQRRSPRGGVPLGAPRRPRPPHRLTQPPQRIERHHDPRPRHPVVMTIGSWATGMRVQPEPDEATARSGAGDDGWAVPRRGAPASARAPGAWPASCSPSRPR